MHWAHQVRDRFPDGQLYVNMRGYDPGQPMPAADALAGFLRALGVPGQDIPPGEDERSARYRSLLAGKRMLVLLDNAGSAEQVRPLLPGTPSCAVVVTSRDALPGLVARDGAARLDLDLLPLEDAVGLLRTLIGARIDGEPEATAELARQCCRLPLALRVAAEIAVTRDTMPLSELTGELADLRTRLSLLAAGGDPGAEVRAVFSWSYRHLDAEAAWTFRLLGLHPGPGIEPYAAAALTCTAATQARRELDILARAHLTQPAEAGRHGLHDLLRAYALHLCTDQDTEDERRAALTRLFDYYQHTAADAMDALLPSESHRRPRVLSPAPPAPAMDTPAVAQAWLDAERTSLVAVTVHMANHGWRGYATRLAAILSRYLEIGDYHREAITIHTCARRAAMDTGDRAAEATALKNLGGVDWRQGRYEQASDYYRQALALFREIGDRAGEANTLNNLAMVEDRQGRYDRASGYYQQALALFRGIGNRLGEAAILDNLGIVEWRQGRCEQAADHCRRALALFGEIGNPLGQASALNNLGMVDERLGRYEQASGYHQQALALFRETGDRAGQAEALSGLGEVCIATSQPGQARCHWREALVIYSSLGTPEASDIRRRLASVRDDGGEAGACGAAARSPRR